MENEPKNEPKSPQKEEELCATAGRFAGAVARRLYILKKQVERQLIKLSRSGRQATQQAIKKGKAVTRDSRSICGKLEAQWQLWHDQQKQQELSNRLGLEVYRLHKTGVADILNQDKVKSFVKQIQEIEERIGDKSRESQEPAKSAAKPARKPRKKKTDQKGTADGTLAPEPA